MAQPHLSLAPRGGYIVHLESAERWWIQSNVEPFRTESRALFVPPFGPFAMARPDDGPKVRLDLPEQLVRSDLLELEQLGMAHRLP